MARVGSRQNRQAVLRAASAAARTDTADKDAVDPRFRTARSRAAGRRRRTWALRGLAMLVLLGAVGLGGWWTLNRVPSVPGTDDSLGQAAPDQHQIVSGVATDVAEADQDEDAGALDAFLDLPGDPLRLNFGAAPRTAARSLPRPDDLPQDRGGGGLVVLRDVMVSTEDRLVTAVPSSREDFAIFQAQRRGLSAGAPPPPDAEREGDALADVLVSLAPTGSDSAPAAPQRHPRTATEAAAFVQTQGQRRGHARIDLRPAASRAPLVSDTVLRVTSARPLVDILREAGLPGAEAEATAAAADEMGLPPPESGHILALRLLTSPGPDNASRLAQLAVYSGQEYLGALARDDAALSDGPSRPDHEPGADDDSAAPPPAAALVHAADPWLGANLLRLAAAAPDTGTAPAQFRVLDAFYSAAMRNQLSAGLVGEVIMLLSEAHDLDAFASPGDRMTLVRTEEPPDDPDAPRLAQVLYVAIEGAEADIRCYLYRPSPTQPHSCYGASRGSGPGAAAVATAIPDGPEGGMTAGAAVEQLVDRIIIIESAGRADARNPLSTATGLGQFIESTWVRMMRTYRPDLYTSLPRAELLALRTDPVISREMVTALAREGEAYLRARGHQITAGRLYLAHFLGMEGAHLVLTQPPAATLLDVLGAAVIRANPFLDGRDVAYIADWAEGRMRGGGGRAVVVRDPPGLIALRAMVDAALREG